MAKKVVNQVVIKDEELTPTTLGVYSNKGKSPVGLILIILIFLALLIFLPNIETYYNKLMGKDDENVSAPEEVVEDDNKVDESVTKYPISSETLIEETEYTVSNIGFNSNILTLSIANTSSNSLDLEDYYLELYNDDDKFIERVKVSDKVLTASSSDNFTYTIKTKPTQLVFIKRTKKDYPSVTVKTNEQNEDVLSCIKANEELQYTFNNDELSKIKYIYTANNVNDQNYSVEHYTKQQQAQTYNNIDGVSATVTTNQTGYTYVVTVTTSKADITKIDLDGVYKNKTTPAEIKFKEEAKGYNCN